MAGIEGGIMSIFLSADEVTQLTGRKIKSKQIEALRKMGLPFHVNASGRPVVAISTIAGQKQPDEQKKVWQPPK
jgi:hypothetical protein